MIDVARLLMVGLLAAGPLVTGCASDHDEAPGPIRHPDLADVGPAAREQILVLRQALDAPGADAVARAQVYGALGMAYHAYGLLLPAYDAYRHAASLAPGNPDWPYYRGLALAARGDHDAARVAFDAALTLAPGDVPALVRLGNVDLDAGRLDAAEASFARALENDPACAAAALGLGSVARAREDHARALEWFERSLALDPSASALHYRIGQAHLALGDEARARDYLARPHDVPVRLADPREQALRDLRRDVVALTRRAEGTDRSSGSGDSLAALRAAIAARPDEPRLHVNLARELLRAGAVDEARSALATALRLDPAYAVAHYDLGVVHDRRGQRADAVDSYRRALDADPAFVVARWNLALDLRRLGRFDEALAELRIVVAEDPARAEAGLVEALTLVRLGRWAEARQRLETSLAAFPEHRGMRQALARVLAAAPDDRVRDGARALAVADPLARPGMASDEAAALAMVAAENGDFATAVRLQENVVRAAGRGAPQVVRDAAARNLARYRDGQPCREPWLRGHPLTDPPP